MINDQIRRADWIDFVRVAAEFPHSVPHGRKVDHGRNAGKILKPPRLYASKMYWPGHYLQNDPCRLESDLDPAFDGLVLLPIEDMLDILPGDLKLVAVSNGRFE